MTSTALITIGVIILVNITFWVVIIKRQKKVRKVIHVPIKAVEHTQVDPLEDRIILFLANNYTNPNLSLDVLQEEFSKGKKGLSVLIKKQTKMTFPQYLTYLRIEESKRLIVKGKFKTISEVGFAVGFNSLSNFIRVFKTQEGVSPKKFSETQNS